jgi:hypothetical protein
MSLNPWKLDGLTKEGRQMGARHARAKASGWVGLAHYGLDGTPACAAINQFVRCHLRFTMVRGHGCKQETWPAATGLGRWERIWEPTA